MRNRALFIFAAALLVQGAFSAGAGQYVTDDRGVVPYWLALGPIPVSKEEAETRAIDTSYIKDEAKLAPMPGEKSAVNGAELEWKAITVAPHTPFIQCDESIAKLENAAAYLVAYVQLEKEEPAAKLLWGSDDSVVIYVNGREVDRFSKGRGLGLDQNTTGNVALRKGVNTVVFKLVNGIGGWGACLRLVDSEGKPMSGLNILPAPEGKKSPGADIWPVVCTSYPFEARTYKDSAGDTLLYRIMKPVAYDLKREYPLVVYLHGAGERGSDNEKQLLWITTEGKNLLVSQEMMSNHPCFIVVPQCPDGLKWVNAPWEGEKSVMAEKPTTQMRLTIELLSALQKEFKVDSKRIYVTGMSMGGYGTWEIIMRKPDTFAAAVPICGGGDETKAALIKDLPIWAFHGDQDPAVKVTRSRNMIAALKAAGGDPRYTEYPGVGHFAWVPAHQDKEMWDWMFSQSRK